MTLAFDSRRAGLGRRTGRSGVARRRILARGRNRPL